MGRAGPSGRYGIDAPFLLLVPALLAFAGIAEGIVSGQPWPLIGAALVIVLSGFGWYANRRGKFVAWSRILDDLHLTGVERVLDLGCGRGAVLVLAAERLTTGSETGVDLWRSRDQSGNSSELARSNVAAAGVADRVEVRTADMTHLPFEDASFDVVVSSLAIHNIPTRVGRDRAIDEAVRVLNPGGYVALADLRATARYRVRLTELGMTDVQRRNLGWRMWWSGPWLATRLVTATKPRRVVLTARSDSGSEAEDLSA